MSLTGRVALVTGGTGALGQAVTRRLLAEGATVAAPFIVDAERDRLQAGVDATAKDRLLLVRADVTDERAVGDLVNTLQARHRRLDVLVTLVGGFAGGGLLETDRATWDRMLTLNLTATFTAARAAVPLMTAAGRGRVVTIGSRAVMPPAGGFIAYTASKSGVIAFTQALAQELRGTRRRPQGLGAGRRRRRRHRISRLRRLGAPQRRAAHRVTRCRPSKRRVLRVSAPDRATDRGSRA